MAAILPKVELRSCLTIKLQAWTAQAQFCEANVTRPDHGLHMHSDQKLRHKRFW